MYTTGVRLHSELFPTERYYPFNIPVLRNSTRLAFHSELVFFVGENGSGKSTLLEALTRKCGAHLWEQPRRHTAHDNPYETRLSDFLEVTWSTPRVAASLFRAETFGELADFLDDVALCDPGRLQYQGGRILNTLSHGEGMLSYLSARYGSKGLYFLDEPEAALSPASQLKFLAMLQRFLAGGTAQFIIATHSPILLACPGAQILSFDGTEIEEVNYEDTAHYRIYREFLTHRERFLTAPDTEADAITEDIPSLVLA